MSWRGLEGESLQETIELVMSPFQGVVGEGTPKRRTQWVRFDAEAEDEGRGEPQSLSKAVELGIRRSSEGGNGQFI